MKSIHKIFTPIGSTISLLVILIMLFINYNVTIPNIIVILIISVSTIYLMCHMFKEMINVDINNRIKCVNYQREMFQYNRAIDAFLLNNDILFINILSNIKNKKMRKDLEILRMGNKYCMDTLEHYEFKNEIKKLKYDITGEN